MSKMSKSIDSLRRTQIAFFVTLVVVVGVAVWAAWSMRAPNRAELAQAQTKLGKGEPVNIQDSGYKVAPVNMGHVCWVEQNDPVITNEAQFKAMLQKVAAELSAETPMKEAISKPTPTQQQPQMMKVRAEEPITDPTPPKK